MKKIIENKSKRFSALLILVMLLICFIAGCGKKDVSDTGDVMEEGNIMDYSDTEADTSYEDELDEESYEDEDGNDDIYEDDSFVDADDFDSSQDERDIFQIIEDAKSSREAGTTQDREAPECNYSRKENALYCMEENGCSNKKLAVAEKIIVDKKITDKGLKYLSKNDNLKILKVRDMSNFSEKDIMDHYSAIVRDDIGLAALLFAYERHDDGFGNNGTRMYRAVMKKKCPSISTLRSCASVVSGAINAAGAADYCSASVAGLIGNFKQDDNWKNLGRLDRGELKSGDVIYIKRSSQEHDHVLVWVGNKKIQRLYPSSKGTCVSGSYDENYRRARSASIGSFSFSGNYKVYRYFGRNRG